MLPKKDLIKRGCQKAVNEHSGNLNGWPDWWCECTQYEISQLKQNFKIVFSIRMELQVSTKMSLLRNRENIMMMESLDNLGEV